MQGPRNSSVEISSGLLKHDFNKTAHGAGAIADQQGDPSVRLKVRNWRFSHAVTGFVWFLMTGAHRKSSRYALESDGLLPFGSAPMHLQNRISAIHHPGQPTASLAVTCRHADYG
jgi:hypothetical protein